MGNDGGSIPDRRDLVKTRPKSEQADKANQMRARWFFCALSKHLLREPVVSCDLGKLCNKDAVIEYLLDKSTYGDGEKICGHIRSLKDVKTLKLTARPLPGVTSADMLSSEAPQFRCPLNLKEMNGVQPFVCIRSCGCVFSQSALRILLGSTPSSKVASNGAEGDSGSPDKELDVCPQCATKFSQTSDILTINPSDDEEQAMRVTMELRRSREPAKSKSRKRKAGADAHTDEADTASKKKKSPPAGQSPSPAPGLNPMVSTASRALTNSLAAKEAKRKVGMSDAVKSLYCKKEDPSRNFRDIHHHGNIH